MIPRRLEPHRPAPCAWLGVGVCAAVWRQFCRFCAKCAQPNACRRGAIPGEPNPRGQIPGPNPREPSPEPALLKFHQVRFHRRRPRHRPTRIPSSSATRTRRAPRQGARIGESQAKLRREIEAIGDDRRALNQQLIDCAARVRDVEANIEATRRAPQAARRTRAISANRSTSAAPRSSRFSPRSAGSAASRRRAAGAAGRRAESGAHRHHAWRRGSRYARRGRRARRRPRRSPACARRSSARAINSFRATRFAGARAVAHDVLIDERQKSRQAAERRSSRAAARRRPGAPGRQPQGPHHQARIRLDAQRGRRTPTRARIEEDATRPDLSALKDPGRLAPAIAFAAARGHLRLPVNGVKIREFGGSDGIGGTQKGFRSPTRAGAQITSPCDGWVVYAGPFRSYGQLLILNVGGGYHVLLAGMERIIRRSRPVRFDR